MVPQVVRTPEAGGLPGAASLQGHCHQSCTCSPEHQASFLVDAFQGVGRLWPLKVGPINCPRSSSQPLFPGCWPFPSSANVSRMLPTLPPQLLPGSFAGLAPPGPLCPHHTPTSRFKGDVDRNVEAGGAEWHLPISRYSSNRPSQGRSS